jgi:hypothetical protein
MNVSEKNISLDRPVNYEIKVPGEVSESWSDWAGITVSIEEQSDGRPISTLTGNFDQAGLLGIIRKLYSMGLPILSVIIVDFELFQKTNYYQKEM